ncbi:PREDICTED: mediator of RNA polymerase II transcription subunit 4 [Tarenaya hassleriana]|uniref:mediator of RNA polymerase II transcription subunit 4 n=1 Tax=Tarenaya hassleriana TaxID=28532 RepID=UPI00053C808E|nr:PREDICTED: mediator of RNA polymerase II transcription subunit 4 [Tarenaya hassleriana]
MLQHQPPARLGLTIPLSPSVHNPTFPLHSTSSQSQHHQLAAPSATVSSVALLSLLPPLPRSQSLLQWMASLASKLFDVSPSRSLWPSAFRGSLPSFLSSRSLPPPPLENPNPSSTKEILSLSDSLQTQLFLAATELREILDLQEAEQKMAREIKSNDSSLLAFASRLKEAERVLDMLVDDYSDYRRPKRAKTGGESQEEEDSDESLSSDLPLPPLGWKPGDPVELPPLEPIPAPKAPPGPHRVQIQVRPVQLDIFGRRR